MRSGRSTGTWSRYSPDADCKNARVTARTLVAFHAHPDDEALLSAGTLARAAADGHRVVLVLATSGDAGLVGDDVLDGAEDLGARRASEAQASADALGVARLVLLGYGDSGSDRPDSATDWPEGSFRAAGSTRPPTGWPPCSARKAPTCSSPTTSTAGTATPTTSR